MNWGKFQVESLPSLVPETPRYQVDSLPSVVPEVKVDKLVVQTPSEGSFCAEEGVWDESAGPVIKAPWTACWFHCHRPFSGIEKREKWSLADS